MTSHSDESLKRLGGLVDFPDLSGTRYDIHDKLAVGGMGSVYRAYDRDLKRHVALKVLTIPDPEGSRTARMMREARVVARLEHPGIVPIHDVGHLADGRVYYTMKLVDGATLEDVRNASAGLPDLLRILLRVCEAVQFAHSHGVIHRDLKPANIMVGAFGEVLVMDWGIALSQTPEDDIPRHDTRLETTANSDGTQTGTILGTPAYMAPEQAEGAGSQISPATDIYGLGAILYFLLTGRPPFLATEPKDILNTVRTGEFPPPRSVTPGVSKQLEAICLKAMAFNMIERYETASELAEDLTAFLDGRSVSAYRESPLEVFARWLRRNRFIVIIVLAYMVIRFLLLIWRGI